MKRFTRFVCLILIMSMVLAVPAMAAERASAYFGSHSCYLWEVSDSEFQVWFDVTAVKGMDVLGACEIVVQRSTDRNNWESVATYTDFYGYNTSSYGACATYSSASSGYYYRAKVTFYAEKGTGCAYYTDYTSSIRT